MSTINYLTVRNTVMPVVNAVTANYSTLTGSTLTGNAVLTSTLQTSTLTVSTMNFASTIVSLGQSTNQTYNNFSNGSYAAGSWVTAKSAMSAASKTVQSANGLYQMIVGNTTSNLFLSSDSGITWSTLSGGLPTLTGSAYWSDGAISANGQYITLSIYGGSLWMSQDYGRTFALTNQPTPDIWLPLNGNTTDLMGLSVVTTPGTVPGYVTLNYPGYTAQAVNLLNTAGSNATRYIRGTWTGSPNFTVSLWFNPQTLSGVQQQIFGSVNGGMSISINASNQLFWYMPSGGSTNGLTMGTTTFGLSINTWYYVTIMFQTNGLCSFYVNNNLISSYTNVSGLGTQSITQFSLACNDNSTVFAFNGYIDDLKITNSVSTYVPIPLLQPNIWMPFENTAGDLGSYSLPPSATPTIYLPFEGNVTDSMGFSTVTAPGTVPGYVAANREGYTGQAVNLLNTVGSNATRYVRGTWSGSANFTVSFWMNPQSLTTFQQQVFAAYSGSMVVYITSSNQLAWYIPSGGGINAVTMGTTSFTLVTNTWYYITIIFQTSGVCSFYVNNALIATYTNVSGVGTLTTTQFSLGCNDNSFVSSFNGYIDDLRIYNSAIPYVPVSVTTVTGSLSYVPGVVGLNAVNLVNPAGGTASNYIRGAVSVGSQFTISGWFNAQSLGNTSDSVKILLMDAGIFAFDMYLDQLRILIYKVGGIIETYNIAKIVTNTWYHIYSIFQTNGTSLVYLNGVQTTSYTGPTLFYSPNFFIIGTNHINTQAFNGYIDDFRIYNAAIPIHVLLPQNYRSLALSGTGQYALAAAASGWVVGSSDTSRTWEKEAVCVGTQSDSIQPNVTGLVSSGTTLVTTPWTQGGVTWVASTSSVYAASYGVSNMFNNNTTNGNYWANSSQTYSTSGNSSGQNTAVQGGVGTVTGDWVQIQSSVPLVMTSYQFATGGSVPQLPKTYYIVGSNDGTTWYPIQYGSGAAQTTTASSTLVPGVIIVNSASVQIFGSTTITTTIYSTTTNSYTYFRLIALSNYWASGSYFELGEWYINFVAPSRPSASLLSLNHTGQYQLVATGPAAGSIMPNLTGLATYTWTQGGVNWRVSASTTLTGGIYEAYNMFDNNYANRWVALSNTYSTAGNSSGISNTILGGVGTVTGDWLQIQSSVPLVMSSYQFVTGYFTTRLPKTYYITGSNDGSNWYPLQYVSGGTVTTTASNTLVPSVILVNSTSTQTFGSSTVATTAYSTSTNAYTYFRLVSLTIYSGTVDYLDIGEWLINFSNSVSYSTNYGSTWLNTSRTVSNESVALSASGQYALSTNSVAPLARLTLDNTNVDAQGSLVPATGAGTVTYSTSIKAVGSHSAQFANATVGGIPTVYLNYTVPAVLNKPSMLTMSFWMYPTGYAATSYVITLTNGTLLGPYFYFRSGNVGLTFNINGGGNQYAEYAQTPPLNAWTHLAMTFTGSLLSFYMNGVLLGTMSSSGSLTLTNGGNITNLFVGTLSASTGAFAGYVDDVRIYTSALNADEINGLFKNPALTQTIAVSSSYLPITSYLEPTLPGITANIVDAAVSQTGQYMVAVTSSTTNNVYYSTDYGATFTALTIGSSAMVSCSISYDGSYLTVENATTVYTLNRNTRGFSVTVGNQAGLVNQAQNAIAIGNQAGRTNQSANSIVLNATGNALDAVAPGFYVAPIGTTISSNATSFALLGYGTDNQVTQTNLTVLSNGNVGLGMTNPTVALQLSGTTTTLTTANAASINTYGQLTISNPTPPVGGGANTTPGFFKMGYDSSMGSWGTCFLQGIVPNLFVVPICLQPNGGNVGIGVTSPSHLLHMFGASPSITTQCNNFYQTTRILLQAYDTNRFSYLSQEETGSLTQILRLGVTNNYGTGIAKQINLETDGSAKLIVYTTAVQTIHLGPQLDNTYDLGWAGVRWRAVWAVNGTIQTSDSNVKDAVPLSYGMNEILQMRTIKYKWKSQADLPDDDPNKNFEYYGFCADELAPLFPELVYNEDTSAPVQMNYSELLPVVVNALKEEHASAVVLKATVDSQAEQIVSLQTKLDALLVWAQTQGYS